MRYNEYINLESKQPAPFGTVENVIRSGQVIYVDDPHCLDDFWEERFGQLAAFNSEKARGLIHMKEWADKMDALQREYDSKMSAMLRSNVELSGDNPLI